MTDDCDCCWLANTFSLRMAFLRHLYLFVDSGPSVAYDTALDALCDWCYSLRLSPAPASDWLSSAYSVGATIPIWQVMNDFLGAEL